MSGAVSNIVNAFVSGYKTYATFGASDYVKGQAPYQGAADALTAPPPIPDAAPAPVVGDTAAIAPGQEAVKSARIKSTAAGAIMSGLGSSYFMLQQNKKNAASTQLLGGG